MMYQIWLVIFLILLPAAFSSAETEKQVNDKVPLTIWIIPFEPPAETIHLEETVSLKDQLSWFNRKQAASNLTVLNTTVDWMVDQLVVWNTEFDLPNWSLINGQEKTLEALGDFAKNNNVNLRVRFLTWKTIVSELEDELNSRPKGASGEVSGVPDVVQIGSTWVPYFAEKKILLPPENPSEKLSWRKIKDVPVSLPCTIDVRLMFYWKKLPGSAKSFRNILAGPSDWQGIIDALTELVLDENNPSPPMVMPVGLTFNLFHDFVPLVWASGDPFFVETKIIYNII
jgi:multiple sugar transport system substrate-binding protein